MKFIIGRRITLMEVSVLEIRIKILSNITMAIINKIILNISLLFFFIIII